MVSYSNRHVLHLFLLSLVRIGEVTKLSKKYLEYLCYIHGPNLNSWCSNKQKTTARSCTTLEYHVLASPASEVYWLQCLFRELNQPVSTIPKIWCDDVSATYLATDPIFSGSLKVT